jgi:ABC-2 type transport system permease protein
VQLAQIAVGVLGVLLITSEYATGLIRTTLAAAPRRLPVLCGSALYLAVAALIGLGLGALLRSTAGGIAALFGLLFAAQLAAASCREAGRKTSASTCPPRPARP